MAPLLDPAPSGTIAGRNRAPSGESHSPAIPFNRPAAAGRELDYIRAAVRSGRLAGDGEFTRKCSALLEEVLAVPRVLLTTSCTTALEMIALLLDVHDGDEVIVPSFTFVSTANAFALRGARPIFADVRVDTLNIDENAVEALITKRTRAIAVMHYAGVGCEMDSIRNLASSRGLAVVEDNAHGLFGTYRGRPLGTFGCMAALSFHETKNLTCGEGGALLINDLSYAERAEILREKGTNRGSFSRGEVDRYTWVDLGSSSLPSEILSAFLYGQLEARERIQAERRRVWTGYSQRLADWARASGVQLPAAPLHTRPPHHLFHLLLPTRGDRDGLIEHLAARGIASAFHYLPLHLSKMGRRFGGREGQCPVAESASERLLRLPFFGGLTEGELDRIAEAVSQYQLRSGARASR